MRHPRILAGLALSLPLATGAAWLLALPAHAQIAAGLQAFGAVTNLPATDPRVIAARIINVVLGLIGIILVSLIVYAGFLWMTSGGKAEQIEKAKAMIRNAIIGLIIVLSSWAIATFVISRLIAAVGGGGGGVTGGGPGGGGFGGGGGATSFQLRSIAPSGSVPLRNVEVEFLFTQDVRAATATSSIQVLRASDHSVVGGTLTVAGSLVTFVPSAPCPAPNGDRFCFDANTDFIAQVGRSLLSTAGVPIVCGGGFALSCSGTFHTGDLVDTQAPAANIISPTESMSVPVNDLVPVITHTTDDSGIARVESYADGRFIDSIAPTASTSPMTYDADIAWDTTGIATGTHVLQSHAYDIDSNNTTSSPVDVVVRPRHCFNGVQDTPQGETGIDCGGECGACSGGACTTGSDCASGVCTAGVCVEKPIITYVSPNNGRPGTLVTISGENFGTSTGRVVLGGQPASAPAACVGIATWSPRQVIVAVPAGAVTGPVQLTNTAGLSDSTNDTSGPLLDDFNVNTSSHPGLCGALPASGSAGDSVNLVGVNLGTVSDHVYFNAYPVTSFTGWNDTGITLNAPVIAPASYATKATTLGVDSNTVSFSLESRTLSGVPTIDTIDPSAGPIGEYVTLSGRNFGSTGGTVKFKIGDEVGTADTTFPAACGTDNWSDSTIIVKVPAQIGLHATAVGAYQVYVQRRDLLNSNLVPFTVDTSAPRPGICSLEPSLGPAQTTQVTLTGEHFGTSPGHLYFSSTGTARTVEASITPGDWSDGQVRAYVPRGSVTGPVRIQAGTTSSNGINFQVEDCHDSVGICAASGETCCDSGACSAHGICAAIPATADYAWLTSTGQIPINPAVVEECSAGIAPPSPSPWSGRPGGDQACVNADLMMRFTTELDPASVTAANILVGRCADATCSSSTPVVGSLAYGTSTEGSGYIRFRPSPAGTEWDASTTYHVIVRAGPTGILSSTGVQMIPKDSCGSGNGYCFNFTTRASTEPCRVGLVSVVPNPFTAEQLGERIPYSAMGRSADDMCIVLNGSTINWQWTVGTGPGPDSHATIAASPTPPNEDATATTEFETGPVGVPINAAGASTGSPVSTGTAMLYIRFIPPRVVDYGPHCDQACINAAIWAKFNVDMDPSRATPQNILLQKCANESCRTFVPLPTDCAIRSSSITLGPEPGTTSLTNDFLTAAATDSSGNSCLEVGEFYKVTLRGVPPSGVPAGRGFLSSSHLGLTGLNDPNGFAWTFRVKTGDQAFCVADHVTVTPGQKIESVIGARQLFLAQPFGSPDACSASGQLLISSGVPYAWMSSDLTVADFPLVSGARTAQQTASNPPSHCSGVCLNTGADGQLGHVASCGDGIVETTDIAYCHRVGSTAACSTSDTPGIACVTRFGDPCHLLPPGSSGGEECDWAVAGRGGLCSHDTCLWNPMAAVSDTPPGTCGNGTVDAGEQCDPGRHCVGGTTDGLDCATDASICSTSSTCSVATSHGCSDTCQALGSGAGGSVCKNGSVGDGETCDYGPGQVAGQGCSDACLHEGSSPSVTSLCGNGIAQAGKSCEMDNPSSPTPAYCSVVFDGTTYVKHCIPGAPSFNTYCDALTCLNKGTDSCTTPGQTECCGNGIVEPGEDCDGGPGCSNRCLLEGSSLNYPVPSFCRDGQLGTGEQCDVPAGTPLMTSANQAFEITGLRDPGSTGFASSTLSATYQTKVGTASYGLQCGFTSEASCSPVGGIPTGLTAGGCCAPRPQLVANYPLDAATNVCRNAQISATFDQPMDQASLSNNFIVAEQYATSTGACPSGQELLDQVQAVAVRGWRAWLADLWQKFIAFITGRPAQAQFVYCVGNVTGTVQVNPTPGGRGSQAIFTISDVLKASTDYEVVLKGSADLTSSTRTGIRSARGVMSDRDWHWTFTTGNRICTANNIIMRDLVTAHPFLYQAAAEAHGMLATVYALQDGVLAPIVPVPEYAWRWQDWISSNTDSLLITDQSVGGVDFSYATGTAQNQNGSSLVFSSIVISNDTVNVPSSTGQVYETSHLAQVMLCERPWQLAPFQDNVYNFATDYCKDAGAGPADDLPVLTTNLIPTSTTDISRGILRQYLFTFRDPKFQKDGIGIRVLSNPLHLSAASWYAAQRFTGSPSALTVDGYDAVRDGTTVYVAAANVDSSTGGPVTSTIYLISHNPDAQPETVNIYNQMLKNWTFNTNFLTNSSNICLDALGHQFFTSAGHLVRCTADWECARQDIHATCGSFKAKLTRDTRRVADFQKMTQIFEQARAQSGSYPDIASGSFVDTLTTSRWPSWQTTLAGASGGTLPQDPVNRFLSCGRCHTSGLACIADADCPTAGETCDAQNGFDPATCWNAASSTYTCPSLDRTLPSTVSHIYQYRALAQGSRYELGTELEIPNSASRYRPPLVTEVKRCANTGELCQVNGDCTVYSTDHRTVLGTSTCNSTGGSWRYNNSCTDFIFGASNVCGDGVLGPGEACEVGDSHPIACTTIAGGVSVPGTKIQTCNSTCSGFEDSASSLCIPDSLCGNGRIDNMRCYGGAGYKYGASCTTSADCADPRDSASVAASMVCQSVALHGGTPEVCDDGALNGTYGHCSRTCTGAGGFCGDGTISPGETCDNGPLSGDPAHPGNGEYCDTLHGCTLSMSCGADCHSQAPHCGDTIVQAPQEQCDGNNQQTPGAICIGGTNAELACTTAADCPGGTCGGDTNHNSCSGITHGLCAGGSRNALGCARGGDCPASTPGGTAGRCIQYPTAHVRTCAPPGSSGQCTYAPWTPCEPQHFCGDGTVDPGEECDSGAANSDTGACTTQCKRNVCGDGLVSRGAEECDNGPLNGAGCTADYGSTCTACSNTCRLVAASGGYCGDNSINGAEQCDGTNIPSRVTCRSLGFDFANNVQCQYDGYVTFNGSYFGPSSRYCCESGRVGGWSSVGGGGGPTICFAPSLSPAGTCVEHPASGPAGATVPISLADHVCLAGTQHDVLACSATCSFAGCGRCQDTPGTASIGATVRDAVFSSQPVVNARVTLYNHGVRMEETFTDDAGNFHFDNLNQLTECSSYSVLIDKYDDNSATPLYDESINGGYWPFQSATFSASTSSFWNDGIHNSDGRIFLLPRVGPSETLVVTEWNGAMNVPDTSNLAMYTPVGNICVGGSNQYNVCSTNADCPGTYTHRVFYSDHYEDIDTGIPATCGAQCVGGTANGHLCSGDVDCPGSGAYCENLVLPRMIYPRLVLPSSMSYPMQETGNLYPDANDCRAFTDNRGLDPNLVGADDLNAVPHAKLSCYQANSATTVDCRYFTTAPMTLRYKRGSWATGGRYSYVLFVNGFANYPSWTPSFSAAYWTMHDIEDTRQFLSEKEVRVYVVTETSIYHISPPAVSPACRGRHWLVFQQDAASGDIIIPTQPSGTSRSPRDPASNGGMLCDSAPSNYPYDPSIAPTPYNSVNNSYTEFHWPAASPGSNRLAPIPGSDTSHWTTTALPGESGPFEQLLVSERGRNLDQTYPGTPILPAPTSCPIQPLP